MAGNSELDRFLPLIQQQIDNFSGSELDDNVLSPCNAKEMRKQNHCMNQIALIEEEIEALSEAIERCRHDLPNLAAIDRLLSKCQLATSESDAHITDELDSEIKELEIKLHISKEITGVNIDDSTSRTIREDSKFIYRLNTLKGSCGDISFELQFEVKESVENFEKVTAAHITKLKVSQLSDVDKWLSESLKRISKERYVQGFFRLMESYSTWKSLRMEMMSQFRQKYPESVSIRVRQDDIHMIITNPQQELVTWDINWMMEVSPIYRVEPVITLSIRAPKQIIELDTSDILKTAPEMFQKMLKECGIQKAIDIILKMAIS